MQNDWVYDIETYYDLFCVDITHVASRTRFIFEVSDRINQSREFVAHLWWLRSGNQRLFGFNNEFFDWPVCQRLMDAGEFTAIDAHNLGTEIITSSDRWAHTVWPSDRHVTQGDLYKIHHFDNMAKSTSLKKLEINMRSVNVVDLPYPPDQPTTHEQKDEIIRYMCHDVSETLKFYHYSLPMIRFRDELAASGQVEGDVLNMNDTKIGKQYFIQELQRSGVATHQRVNGRRQPVQTVREQIALRDVISPKVSFQHPEFQRILTWLQGQVLTKSEADATLGQTQTVNTKGVFKDVSCTIDGFQYDFGTGGIHGSQHNVAVHEDGEWEIWDWDVASYYPNLAITNGAFPAHLGQSFCDIYQRVYDMRREYAKGTPENAMLKLALNGVYGDSNNKYGPFFDPQYTMTITINGQLLLCMLAEWLTMTTDGVEMIQINTDGLTIRVRKDRVEHMRQTCALWEQHTGLTLEDAQYRSMFIADVNSYIAVTTKGKIKRIGRYAYETAAENPATRERGWHADHSMLVVRKAAEAQMVHGIPVEQFIDAHRDPFDFMLSIKVPRNGGLYHGEERIQNTTRYYVSTDGAGLVKTLPPLKGKTEPRRFDVQKGWTTTVVNDARRFDWSTVNWYFYHSEARKLLI